MRLVCGFHNSYGCAGRVAERRHRGPSRLQTARQRQRGTVGHSPVLIQPGYESKTKGWTPTGPEQEVPLNSFERTAYMVCGIVLGLGGIYCFAMSWIHRKPEHRIDL